MPYHLLNRSHGSGAAEPSDTLALAPFVSPPPPQRAQGKDFFMKRAIITLSVASITVGLIVVIIVGLPVSKCVMSPQVSCAQLLTGAIFAGALGMVTSVLLGGVAWAFALFQSGMRQQWLWFTLTLLLDPIGALLYGITGIVADDANKLQ
jgi:hypothetical protein